MDTKSIIIHNQQNFNINLMIWSVWCAFGQSGPSQDSSWVEGLFSEKQK